jgi:tetratricopeptide (TPR) repeat protein
MFPIGASGQQVKEADLVKQATPLFEDGKYIEAAPLYERLLSLNQESPEYNYKYGACLIYSDGDKSNALKRLRYAAQKPGVPYECYFFLGKAYHLNYMFADAIIWYNKFAAAATPKEKEKFQVDRHAT